MFGCSLGARLQSRCGGVRARWALELTRSPSERYLRIADRNCRAVGSVAYSRLAWLGLHSTVSRGLTAEDQLSAPSDGAGKRGSLSATVDTRGRSRRFYRHARVCQVQDIPVGELELSSAARASNPSFPGRLGTDMPQDIWTVLLDGSPVVTPYGCLLTVPSQALALGIAAEWESQTRFVVPGRIPLITLAATTIDVVPVRRGNLVHQILQFLNTDTVCYRTPEPAELFQHQSRVLDPLVAWFQERFGATLRVTASIYAPDQSDEVLGRVQDFLTGKDHWELAAIDSLVHPLTSFVLTLAVLEGQVSPEEALKLSRTEAETQLSQFPRVPAAHDVDVSDLTMQIATALAFTKLAKTGQRSHRGIRYVNPQAFRGSIGSQAMTTTAFDGPWRPKAAHAQTTHP